MKLNFIVSTKTFICSYLTQWLIDSWLMTHWLIWLITTLDSYKQPDLSPRFTCKVNLSNINFFRNTKNPAWLFFLLAFPLDRGMQRVNWQQPRTIVLHKVMFWGCPIIYIVSVTEWLERLRINLIKQRWSRLVTGFNFFVWEKFVLSTLIEEDAAIFRCTYKTINAM